MKFLLGVLVGVLLLAWLMRTLVTRRMMALTLMTISVIEAVFGVVALIAGLVAQLEPLSRHSLSELEARRVVSHAIGWTICILAGTACFAGIPFWLGRWIMRGFWHSAPRSRTSRSISEQPDRA